MAITAGVINGTDFIIYLWGTAVAYSNSCTVNISMSKRDTSSKSGSWVDGAEGKRDWNITGEALFQFTTDNNLSTLFDLLNTETKIRVLTSNEDDEYYEGTGYLTSLTVNYPGEENSTYSFTFEGNGELEEFTEVPNLITGWTNGATTAAYTTLSYSAVTEILVLTDVVVDGNDKTASTNTMALVNRDIIRLDFNVTANIEDDYPDVIIKKAGVAQGSPVTLADGLNTITYSVTADANYTVEIKKTADEATDITLTTQIIHDR